MICNEVQERLALAQTLAADPATLFCIEPFSSFEDQCDERLGKLLARVMCNPDRSLLVVTRGAFIFAFADRVTGLRGEVTSGKSVAVTPTAVQWKQAVCF